MGSRWQCGLAEAIGTFGLVFMGAGSIIMDAYTHGGVGLIGIALAHAVALSVAVTATLRISGGHLNPAVTIALWSARRISAAMGVLYIAAQLAGAVAAAFLLNRLYPAAAVATAQLGTTVLAEGVSMGQGVLIELVLTFFLVFAVFGTAVDERAPHVGGFGIGLVLLFDILAAGPLTGASMNPARTFGPALVGGVWSGHLVYWIGPIAGSLLAAFVYGRLLAARPRS